MSLGLVFPGQGTQHAGMLPWLDTGERMPSALTLMQAQLGADWRRRLQDADWAARNSVAQPLLTGVALAAWERLQPLLPAPRIVAGYSVGEVAAFCVAGAFDTATAMALVQRRACLMDDCVRGTESGLLSVTGATPVLVDALCRTHGLDVAIRTSPGGWVLGGATASLPAAELAASAAGARCTRPAVQLASHTRWLEGAVAPFAAALESMPLAVPGTLLVCNLTGQVVRSAPDLRRVLSEQIASTVWWDRCMATMAERGVRCVLELGPGATLARLWNAQHPEIPARSVDEFHDPRGAAQWVRRILSDR